MSGNRAFVPIGVALLFLVATACSSGRGRKESVEIVWRPEQGAEIQWDAAAKNAPMYKTLVLVSNDTGATLRDASLRFQLDGARHAPVGLRVGTVASISSRFEGADQLWSVGDLEPGAHVSVPLGLWFDLDHDVSQPQPIELTLGLVSRDLPTPVESNALKVHLTPQ